MAAACGFGVVLAGVTGIALERGPLSATATPEEIAAFFVDYRMELLGQTFVFVLSSALFLWFLGGLRSLLLRAEGKPGTLSNIAFGAGLVWITIAISLQGPQSALAMVSVKGSNPELAALMSELATALSVIAFVPMGAMLAAVAVVWLRSAALPAFVGWLAAVAAIVHLVMSAGVAVDSGPLSAESPFSYMLTYSLMVLWLLAAAITMFKRSGRSSPENGNEPKEVSP